MDDNLKYQTITEQEFNKLAQEENGLPFLVVFSADWLGEGTIMDTIIESIAETFEGRIGFYRIDIEQSHDIARHLGIRRLPAMFFFKNGEIIDHFAGMVAKRAIEQRLNNLL